MQLICLNIITQFNREMWGWGKDLGKQNGTTVQRTGEEPALKNLPTGRPNLSATPSTPTPPPPKPGIEKARVRMWEAAQTWSQKFPTACRWGPQAHLVIAVLFLEVTLARWTLVQASKLLLGAHCAPGTLRGCGKNHKSWPWS